jgi:hypothetical protein
MFSFCKHYFFQKFFCKEGAHCTSCFVVVFFSLILQNRTIGFEKLLKWENKNRRCTIPFGTKEFMKLMNLAIWYYRFVVRFIQFHQVVKEELHRQ